MLIDGYDPEVVKSIITEIAKNHLNIPTLVARKSDELDFHDCSVWRIKQALETAYHAGVRSAGVDNSAF